METATTDVPRQSDADMKRTDGNEFVHRRSPGSRVCQVYHVEDKSAGLVIHVTINEAGPFNAERNIIASDPANEIGQEICVIRQIVARKAAIKISREECHATSIRNFAQDKARRIALRFAHPDRFWRIDREGWNESEGNLGIWIEA